MDDQQFDALVGDCLTGLAAWRQSLTGEAFMAPDIPYTGSDDTAARQVHVFEPNQ